MTLALSIPASDLSEAQRTALADWQAQLERLVTRQRTTPARKVHGDLGRHLSSALRGAHEAIGEVCAPAASEMLATAVETVAPYFRHPGDARQAAANFEAFTELQGFERRWKGHDTLSGLADQAEATAKLIARLLAGEEVWRFEGGSR